MNNDIGLDELEILCSLGQHLTGQWIFNDDALLTYRGVIHQLYAQMLGWA